jgi:hypothetical protein
MAYFLEEKRKKEPYQLARLEYGTGRPTSAARGGAGVPSTGWNLPLAGGMRMGGMQDYAPPWINKPARLDPYQAQLEQERIDRIQPVSPTAGKYAYDPQTESTRGIFAEAEGLVPGLGGDFVPKYQDVNPFIWNQMTGERDRSGFDSHLELMSARHPNFSAEYAANPLEALQRYDPQSYHLTGPAHDYYTNPDRFGPEMPPGLLGMTPDMIDDSSGMDAATLARTGGILPPAGLLGNV